MNADNQNEFQAELQQDLDAENAEQARIEEIEKEDKDRHDRNIEQE